MVFYTVRRNPWLSYRAGGTRGRLGSIRALANGGAAGAAWLARKAMDWRRARHSRVSASRNWAARKAHRIRRSKMKGGIERSLGLGKDKVVHLVYRGALITTNNQDAVFHDMMYFNMADCRDPGVADANITALWRTCAAGFDYLSNLYRAYYVVKSVATVSIRQSEDMNLSLINSGTISYYNPGSKVPPIVFGALLTDGASTVSAQIPSPSWDVLALEPDKYKAGHYHFVGGSVIRFRRTYFPRKTFGESASTRASLQGTRTASPTDKALLLLWNQVKDKVSVPVNYRWIVEWSINYTVKFRDWHGATTTYRSVAPPSS